MATTSQFVREAATRLDRHAAEQRAASTAGALGGAGTGPGGSNGSVAATSDDALDRLGGLVDSLGLGRELIELLDGHPMLFGDDGTLVELIELLGGAELGVVLKMLEPVLDVGVAVVDLITDFVEHPGLTFDERIVHALVDMGTRLGLEQGVETAATALAGMLTPLLIPGAGAVMSSFVAKGVGIVVGEAMDLVVEVIDDGTDIVDQIADLVAGRWREIKAGFGIVYDAVGPVIAMVGEAGEIAGDVGGVLVDAGGAAIGAVGSAGSVVGSLNPFD